MRVCFVADAASSHTERWCRHFARKGHDVHVFSLRPAVIPGVLVHQLCPWWSGKSGYLTTLGRLREMLHHLQPDLVHAHYLTSYGLLAVLACRHPLVVSMWGSDVLDFPKRSPLHARLVRWIMTKADLLLSTSQAMASQADWLRPVNHPIHVTPFGVDLDRFQAVALPVESALTIGAVANLVPEKGLDVLLQAFAVVRQQPGLDGVRLRLVGDGPERARLEAQVAGLGLREAVTFLGQVAASEVAKELQRMAVVAMPSRRESFGVAALEAAACGRPVIASRIDGLTETVAEGISGVLVPAGDVGGLAEALAGLLRDSDKREAMGRSARDWVAQTYAWEQTAAEMERLYGTVIRPEIGNVG